MYLLENNIFDYAKTDIAKDLRISRATLNTIWGDLLTEGLITKTRTVGRAELYQIDMDNPIIKKLEELNNIICDIQRDRIVAEELRHIPRIASTSISCRESGLLIKETEGSMKEVVIGDFTRDIRLIKDVSESHKKIITTEDTTATCTTTYVMR